MDELKRLCSGLPLDPLPDPKPIDDTIPHAPVRTTGLNFEEEKVSLLN